MAILADIYDDYATFHTAVELIDDSKILAIFPWAPQGGKEKIIVVKKT